MGCLWLRYLIPNVAVENSASTCTNVYPVWSNQKAGGPKEGPDLPAVLPWISGKDGRAVPRETVLGIIDSDPRSLRRGVGEGPSGRSYTHPSIIGPVDPSRSRHLRDGEDSGILAGTRRSAKCYGPRLRDVRGDLEGCPKVCGVEKPSVGRNPNIASDRRVDHNFVWGGGATKSSIPIECSASVFRDVK